ncbi:DNA methyltransferase [Rubrivirga sp. SAORIC476]|uniref:DNA adenine methylase n=1 Tax=Rubrivirga sp. SAORIC476 TaxID=1961794 RepID=UPI000BA8EFF9|nr:DNA adenine methylase [Rubrivirga sp. SAORIC476]PAP74798.1 DNA methyltransferase [Rubrivirga sp. SAORIC476]
MSHFLSPLRYPGGKRKLSNFVKLVYRQNNLLGGIYAEPYAGGAAVALSLLFGEYARNVYINDIDRSIYAFWKSVLDHTDELCRRIDMAEVSVEEWERQRSVQDAESPSLADLGFSTFYLNRTNRSGIIRGGVIGGREQDGDWKIDARFNKADLIKRIKKIARYKSRITLSNLDATIFLEGLRPVLDSTSLVYLDPPYYVKGGDLYENHYRHEDHELIARLIMSFETPWLVTYDDVKPICDMYLDSPSLNYGLSYSAQDRYKGSEVMFYSDGLLLPEVEDPARIRKQDFNVLQKEMQF